MAVTQEVKFDMIRNLRVADYVTLCNGTSTLHCQNYSLYALIWLTTRMQRLAEESFITAHVFMYLGYEFDRIDGAVARWRNECSEMGKELDSLSDLVTFGLAPIMMLYCMGFRTPVDQIALAFFVICSVARLARFNVTTDVIPRNAHGKVLYFEGLNCTYSVFVVSTAALVCAWLDWTSEGILFKVFFHGTWCEFHPAMISVIAISATMVSKRLKLRAVGLFVIPTVTVVVYAGCWSLSPPRF